MAQAPKTSTQTSTKAPEHTPYWRPVFNLVGMIALVVSVILVLFAWPVASSAPSDVPVGIVANTGVAAQIEKAIDYREPGGFSFTTYPTRKAAQAAIEHREIYGAIVIDQKPTVFIATAANPGIAAMLNTVALQLGYTMMEKAKLPTITVDVEDLAPYTPEDRRGMGLAAASLPLGVAGIVAAILGTLRLRRVGQKFALAAFVSITTSFMMALILHYWLHSLDGPFGGEMLAIMFGVLAVSSMIIGLQMWLKTPGLIAGIVLFFVFGSALSGAALAPEFYPGWLGHFGQILPLGAELSLLRRLSFFPDAPTVAQWFTLLIWSTLGLGMMWSSRWRDKVFALRSSTPNVKPG